MDATRTAALLRQRLEEFLGLTATNAEFEAWRRKTNLTLRRALGDKHQLVEDFENIVWYSGLRIDSSVVGRDSTVGVLEAAIYELEELTEPADFASDASIDPELWAEVGHLVEQEKWAQVASQTAIFVESKIRQWAGLPDSKFGKDLMVAVLKPGAGLFPLGRTPGEHEGWLSLGIGITMAVGNADRHRIQQRDDAKRYAMGVLGAGSLLLTQLRHQHANSFQT
jgi:hypothetical protein